jgi:hypothetical protein
MFVSRFLNWERIRSVGELQILTKASYIALILVPIMAGLWPSVRVAINHYNKVATEASIILETTQASLNAELKSIKVISATLKEVAEPVNLSLSNYIANIENKSEELNKQVNKFLTKFNPEELDTPKLPMVWVFAFFGSLLVIVGHTIYQASAPDIVKNYTKLEFMDKRREEEIKAGITNKRDLDSLVKEAVERYDFISQSGLLSVKLYAASFYFCGLTSIGIVIYFQIKSVILAAGL